MSFAEKATATHSSTLAWKIPWMEEPGRLQSMGSQSRTRLSDFTFTFHFHALEKETATHSSVLAWRTPWTGEPGGLPSMGSHRAGHDWSDLAAAACLWLLFFPQQFESSDSHLAFLNFFFFGMVLVIASCTMSETSIHSSSSALSYLLPWVYSSLLYNPKGF